MVRQSNAAAKSLGFPSADDGRITMQRVRLLFLQHVGTAFARWTAAASSVPP